ncbi:MAG: ribosome maturation factor RimP [Myxococcaceae bacterium]|nr:ribosome maturation factor RimP [Myxococcaceae bacterium]
MAETLRHTVEEKVRQLAEGLVAGEGCELVDVEFLREQGGWVLRVYIDKPGGRVGLDECTAVSRALDPALDVEDLIPHAYSLEVSSPGLNRPLRKPEHFRRAVGQKVKVKTFGPIGDPPRKNFSGVLSASDDEQVTVEVEGAGAFTIPMRDIAKAHLEYEF